MFNSILIYILYSLLSSVITMENREELLKMKPELWPGHLEPFGSKQKTVEVKTIDYWPEPIDFFKEYVEGNVPVVFKGLAKRSPAYELFTDEFLKSFDGADSAMITAEPKLKEVRNTEPETISFKSFVERYHNETLYMVNSLPKQLRKYVLMPAPLRCEETRELMSSQVTWFSGGGTKSVVHNDDVDNINCLYRGTKELLFVEYNKNKKFVPIDHPQGGYSSIDVDKVNYTKYPMLRHVDQYHHVTMKEGDCLFIPYHWFHQVNSVASENGQNLAVNVWFAHVFDHRPKNCLLSPNEATLDKFKFPDESGDAPEGEEGEGKEGEGKEGEGDSPRESTLDHFESYLQRTKRNKASLRTFEKILVKDRLVNPTRFKLKDIPEEISTKAKELFERFDTDKDGVLSITDFDSMHKLDEEKAQSLDDYLNSAVAVIEDIFEDIVENENQAQRIKKSDSSKKDEL